MIRHLIASRDALDACIDDPNLPDKLESIVVLIVGALRGGSKVLLCGNGGSAADVQHLAAEFVGRYAVDRPPLPAVALTTDTSVLTAVGNDYGFDRVFARQVAAIGRKDDVLLAFSTSGRSSNVLRAVEQAQMGGLVSIGFTGSHADEMLSSMCDYALRVPSTDTPIVQQLHMAIGHAICGEVERRMFG